MSRAALGRLLRRRGHSRLPQPEKPANPSKPFKTYLPGYFPVDVKYLPQMADETSGRYAFVAIGPSPPARFFVQLGRPQECRKRSLLPWCSGKEDAR